MGRYSSLYEIEVKHPGLNKYRVIRGSHGYEVQQRADALSRQWNAEWARRQEVDARREERLSHHRLKEDMKEEAAERTENAETQLASLSMILAYGLRDPSPFRWDLLKDRRKFSDLKPRAPDADNAPDEPLQSASKYKPKVGLLEHLIPSRKSAAMEAAKKLFGDDRALWAGLVTSVHAKNAAAQTEHQKQLTAWEIRKAAFEAEQAEQHASVDARATASLAGEEDAVDELLDLSLAHVVFPDCVNASSQADYVAITQSCVIDLELPNPDAVPTLKEVRYVQSREEFTEKHISEGERSRLYDNVLYQITLRTIVCAFAAEPNGHLQRVTLNGWVDYVDRASGMDQRSCILSVSVNRADFDRIDFGRVDPKECFRSLKGVAASKLIGLAPVAPLERPRIVDARFIESQEIASSVNASINLAAMDWKDFEHLVRQVFENEFASPGSEVRVTQASRDGGVDAIVFDPDPIKGGKIVIQAKRYTNTVEVGAVRDLYGTVVNEGATKGILVTTSQFGPDAHKFAQGKPLTLLDGGNLLFLLERMGVAARIDLKEAKATLLLSN